MAVNGYIIKIFTIVTIPLSPFRIPPDIIIADIYETDGLEQNILMAESVREPDTSCWQSERCAPD